MSDRSPLLVCLLGLLLALVACQPARSQGEIEAPGRVGRVADLAGTVSWFDLEQGRWAAAVRNRPLTSGDRIATGRDARAELRIGSTTIVLAEATELEFLRLDDEQLRIELHRGSLALRLRSREVAAQTVFGTAEAWLRPLRGGLYRLDREDDSTHAGSWRGELQVEEDPTLAIDSGRRLQLWREGPARELRHRWREPVDDAFAQRLLLADREETRSASAVHVSPEMTGWEELDRHGRWDRHPDLGPVWMPFGVGVDWVPYRDGRWAWMRPWGWTWIDNAPWGFAPFHYGRWVEWRARWVWVPGAHVPRPVFAPGEPRPWHRAGPRHPERIDPPHRHGRHPPPDKHGGVEYGRGGVPRGVTVVPADVLRQPPLPPRPPRDWERESERGRNWDRDRAPGPDRGHRPIGPIGPAGPALQPPAVQHPPVMAQPQRQAPVMASPPARMPAATPEEPPRPPMRPLPVRPQPPPESRDSIR